MSNLDPVVQIGEWYYQVIYGQLWPVADHVDADQMIRLEPRLHSLLNFFLLHPNTLLAKDTLIEKVWPAEEGTDAAVMRAVGALRKILGDDVRTPLYIATVSKKGYCWLVEPKPAKLPEYDNASDFVEVDELSEGHADLADEHWSWRFIFSAAFIILVCCASLAYVLASYTATPLIKLPDTISPISALSGQEYWPVLDVEQSKVIYQHQMPNEKMFNWTVQQLSDLRVEHLPERYISLSQAQWLDDSQIVFRAFTAESGCHFYKQTIQPVASAPITLRPCQTVIQQGLLPWQDKWLWLDTDELGRPQLWNGALNGQANILTELPTHWRALENLLVHGEQIFLLVQETQNNSALFRLELPDLTPQLIMRFNYLVDQFSWWDENQLLLAPLTQELQLLDIKSATRQGLGPLTRELTHAVRYPGQVLAAQYLDYTTDIYQINYRSESATVDVMPWHVSNRSETLLAHSNGQTVFVSERAGHSQIWLAQGRDSVQLSRLNENQTVQQLFWHKGELLVLINGQLFQLNPTSNMMKPYLLQPNVPGRYISCDNQLYWTELTDSGWQLYMQRGDTAAVIKTGVADVRCGPAKTLLLQFVDSPYLMLLDNKEQMKQLPVALDWRRVQPEHWFSDSSGVYWLASDNKVRFYNWRTESIAAIDLPEGEKAIAIYSNGEGLGFIVRPRPYDTDIVWLQNRR